MKLQISDQIDKGIEGYVMCPVVYGKVELGVAPDNAATQIVAPDALDQIPSEFLVEFIGKVIQKMRFGCELIIGGTDLSALAKDVIYQNLTTPEFNAIVYGKRGIYRLNDIINLLTDARLVITKAQIKGKNYEITAVRPHPQN